MHEPRRAALLSTRDGGSLFVRLGPAHLRCPVLLLHGWAMTGACWDPVHGPLIEAGLRPIAPDLRGHGKSAAPVASPYTVACAEDLACMIQAIELEAPIVVAWSYAALIIDEYLRRYGDERLGAVMYVGAMLGLPGTSSCRLGDTVAEGLLDDDANVRRAADHALVASMFARLPTQDARSALLRATRGAPATVRRTLLEFPLDARPGVGVLDAPCCVVHGDLDRNVPPSDAYTRAALLRTAGPLIYEGCGHALFLEETKLWVGELRALAHARRVRKRRRPLTFTCCSDSLPIHSQRSVS